MKHVSGLVDVVGVGVIVLGILWATAACVISRIRGGTWLGAYAHFRRGIGRAILLGLEVLVAADIVRTIAVELSFEALGHLAIIVLIRTFMSMALELELTGRWPWQQRQTETAGAGPAAAQES
jgi:uncharacterized membrane protein